MTSLKPVSLALFVLLLGQCQSNPKTPIKNILLITLDTTRADVLGIYGNKNIQTPNLDHLALNGNFFSQCFSHAPITLPSHTSILTGLNPLHHGVHNNINYALPDTTPTLATLLKEKGYRTGAFVSSFILDSRFGLSRGFDLYEDNIVHYKKQRDQKEILTRRAGDTIHHLEDWLSQSDAQQPFFAWLHLYDAHAPYEAPLPFRQAYASSPYFGEVAYVDYELGRLFEFLDAQGLDKETLIIVTADHGDSFEEHGEATHGFFCYSTTTHVPLILSKPLFGSPGKNFQHRVQSADIFPTVLEVLGISETPQTDGIPLDQTKERTVYAEAIIPQEDFYLAPVHGLKDSAYSFYYSSTKELYDLKKDPLETHNLADSQPKRLKAYEIKMELLLDQAHLDHARVSLDQDSIELLRSLGYVAEGGAGLAEEDPFAFRSPLQSVKMYRELQRLRSFEETYPFKFREGLRNLIQQDPRQIVLYRDLGRTAAFAGDEKEALDNLRKAALLKPNDPRLHTFLGLGLYRFARFQEAIQEFDVALKLNPHHQSALYNKALTYAALGEIDTALQTFEQVLEVDPNDALTLNNLAFLSLSEKGEWQQAKAFIVRAFEINPKHPLILANKVWIETYPQP